MPQEGVELSTAMLQWSKTLRAATV